MTSWKKFRESFLHKVRESLEKSPKLADRTLYLRFISALFSGGFVTVRASAKPGSVAGWNVDALRYVIDEGRRQLDDQMASLNRILLRAQLLFTTVLALIALVSSSAPSLVKNVKSDSTRLALISCLVLSMTLLLLALLGSAALIAVKKPYDVISVVVISTWERFDLELLAQEFAESIGLGNGTNNAHLTIFTRAVRFTVCGALGLGLALLMRRFF